MKEFMATTTIAASPEVIWAILTDAASYPDWDPGMIRLEGTIAHGEKITAYTKISPNRAFPVTVDIVAQGKKMTWGNAMPLGAFSGVRTFTLDDQGDGTVRFTAHEQFTGWMLPIIGRTIPDLTDSFVSFVLGLKERAEGEMKK